MLVVEVYLLGLRVVGGGISSWEKAVCHSGCVLVHDSILPGRGFKEMMCRMGGVPDDFSSSVQWMAAVSLMF